jgi:hypothetical protein
MSMIEHGGSTVPVTTHTDAAQERMEELRRWREQIPRFLIPPTSDATQRLSAAAAVPPEFIELTNVAVANQTAMVRGEGMSPAETRDLVAYSDAYNPLADELEALAHFIRYSTKAARHRAGTEALMRYSLAQRLAKLPENAALVPAVADMRRALGRGRKLTPEQAAQKAAAQAAKAAARIAGKTPKALPAPAPDTTTDQQP